MNKFIPFLFLALTNCAHNSAQRSIDNSLRDFSIEAIALDYKIILSNDDQNFKMIEATGEAGTNLVVTLYKDKDAEVIEKKYEEKIVKIKSIFESVTDHYFAIITKKIQCEPKYLPKFYQVSTENQVQFSVQAFGNSRNMIGACDSSTVQRKIVLVLLKCKNSIVELQFSTSLDQALDQFKPAISSLKCLF